jgi:hypothetical protein
MCHCLFRGQYSSYRKVMSYLRTPTTTAFVTGIRVGREGFRRTCGAGMILGRTHVHDDVKA